MGLYYHHSINDGFSRRALIIMRITTLVIVISMMMFSGIFAGVVCPVEEYEALLEFKASCNGASPPSWGKQRDCCLWEGVTCSNSTEQVSELDLSELFWWYKATGDEIIGNGIANEDHHTWQLNLSIFSSFRELRHLDLSSNYFTGPLSSAPLAGLKKLTTLDLSGNQLTGEIPTSLRYLSSLEVLNLSRNKLSGLLSSEVLREVKNLRELRLEENQFCGSLPPTLANLTSLQHIDLSYNFLEGNISEQLFTGLVSLQYLDLSYNYLHGKFSLHSFANMSKLEGIILSNNERLEVHINRWSSFQQLQLRILMLSRCKLDENAIRTPMFLCSQHHLEVLDLSYNNLAGNIPTCLLNNNTKLEYLNLGSNLLTGPIHFPNHHIESMNTIDVSRNQLGGSISSNISMVFPHLFALNFSSNNLTGNICSSVVNMTQLQILDLSNNNLIGEVPAYLISDTRLAILKLSNNNLYGKIHNQNSTLVDVIYLDGNKLLGTLSSSILSKVNFLDARDNNLDGSISEVIPDSSFLSFLVLKGNHFQGQIPQSLCNLTGLLVLDLSYNNFSGSLPLCFPPGIIYLNLAGNALTGKVPSVLFNLWQLIALDISKNSFSGLIPIQIESELPMSILILRENSFEGLMPIQLCNLQNLQVLDLSHNKFFGSIPSCLGSMAFRFIESQPFYRFPRQNQWTINQVIYVWKAADSLNLPIMLSYEVVEELQGEEFTTKGNLYWYQRTDLVSMTLIDISGNNLTGKIPLEIGNLSGLLSLNLSYNQLTGPIPEALSNLYGIESFDVSNNRLSGDIPWQLGQLNSLEVFFVAQNNLSGCIPAFQDQLATFDKATYEGNVGLHGPPLDETCTTWSNTTTSFEEENKEVSSIDRIIYYAISTTAYIGGFWISIAFLFCTRCGRSVRIRLDSYADFLYGEVSMVVHKLVSMNRGGKRNRENRV